MGLGATWDGVEESKGVLFILQDDAVAHITAWVNPQQQQTPQTTAFPA